MERIGAMLREDIEDFRSSLRTNIFADIRNNSDGHLKYAPAVKNLLAIETNDYLPPHDDEWDPDKYDERQGIIYAPCGRAGWTIAYRIARTLRNKGRCIIAETQEVIELPATVVISTREAA